MEAASALHFPDVDPRGQVVIDPKTVVRIEGRGMHTLRGQFDMLRGDPASDGGKWVPGWC